MAGKFSMEVKEMVMKEAINYLRARRYEVERHVPMVTVKTKNGFDLEIPQEFPPYDLLVNKEGEDQRFGVSVKIAVHGNKRSKSWRISHFSDSPDIFLVWLPHLKKFIQLPGDYMEGSVSCVRTLPANMTQGW